MEVLLVLDNNEPAKDALDADSSSGNSVRKNEPFIELSSELSPISKRARFKLEFRLTRASGLTLFRDGGGCICRIVCAMGGCCSKDIFVGGKNMACSEERFTVTPL